MVCLALGSILFLGIMSLPGEIFNIIEGNSKYPLTVNQLFLLLLGLLAVQAVFSYGRVLFMTIVGERSTALLRSDLFEKLLTLGIPYLETRRVGELTSRITNDVTRVQSVLSLTLAEFVRQLIVLTGGLAYIFFAMSKLALTMLLTFPIVVVLAMFFGRYIRKLTKERQDVLADTNVIVEESMQSIRTVKAYTNEAFERNRYVNKLEEVVRIALKAASMRGLFAGFIILVLFGSLFFVMWQAALLVQAGTMASGDLFNFVVFTGIIGAAIASLGSFYTEIVAAVGATDRILDILENPAELKLAPVSAPAAKSPASEALPRFDGHIQYENVQFSYPTRPDVTVLKGIDLDISPGSKIALVGASGSGKSTIVNLLLRFYEPGGGTIRVDGRDIASYPLSAYRQQLAIVPQEVLLFGGTIRENIAYGRTGASDPEIIEAARQANAWDFIRQFPDGLDTLVGDRGVKLSGGQRQRIAIARAILKDPAILLLDEATSSLDAESEKLVQGALDHLMQGRTSIIIAHRLATIREADCIYVIDGGQIVEAGTHTELSALEDGAYNNLARLQFDNPLNA
jgi:ABC-type multidrug transport system fused ATPase/permease subunit